MRAIFKQIKSRRYNYLFLKSVYKRLGRVRDSNVDIIAGNSYSVYGLYPDEYPEAILVGMISQDLYYNILSIKKMLEAVINNNVNIRNIYIITGYYFLYNDVSLGINERVTHVGGCYYPLWKDSHNWEEPYEPREWHKQILFPKFIRKYCEDYLIDHISMHNSYYGEFIYRGTWDGLNTIDLDSQAKLRALQHNKLKKYKKTYEENSSLIKDFYLWLQNNNLTAKIIIPPYSSYYLKYIDKSMKSEIVKVLSDYSDKISFHDCNEYLSFSDDCFCDSDHLSDKGAILFTKYLKTLSSEYIVGNI